MKLLEYDEIENKSNTYFIIDQLIEHLALEMLKMDYEQFGKLPIKTETYSTDLIEDKVLKISIEVLNKEDVDLEKFEDVTEYQKEIFEYK